MVIELSVTERELERVDALQARDGFTSRGEFMRRVIGLFDKLTAEIRAGKSLVLVNQDGTTTGLLIIDLL